METYVNILLGAIVMGDITAGLFFLRYWRLTDDRFFLFFAASFFVGAVSRIIIDEHVPPFGMEIVGYVARFLQYFIILLAIVDKNRGRAPQGLRAGRIHLRSS